MFFNTKMRFRAPLCRAAVCLALIAAFAGHLRAQAPQSGVVQERATATVIEVPVNVLGKDGKPLAGLTAADFELSDNGKKQAISGFQVVDLRRFVSGAPNPFPEAPPPAARRHWLLAFDLTYSNITSVLRAREGAKAFVEKGMSPFDLAGVATLSIEHGWTLLENFTSDRAQLARAIETLGAVRPGIRTNDPLGFAFVAPGQGGNELSEDDEWFQDLLQKGQDLYDRGRIAQHMASLGQMARILDSVRGRKHVLLFSEGFESRLLMGNAGKAATPLGQRDSRQDKSQERVVNGKVWLVDSDARFGSTASRGFMESALAAFQRSDVILDTIDISGLQAAGQITGSRGSGTDMLFTMADATNGDFIRNANELSGELEKLIDRTALVYILAFQARSLSNPGAFHELKVKVNVPTSKVTCRSGYYEPRPYKSLSPEERMLASGDLLTGGGTAQLSMHMLAAPFAAGGKTSQVPVILEIPGRPLLEDDAAPSSQIQIYAYASDANGTLTDYLTQEVRLDLKVVRARLEAGGIKYYGTLLLPPGQYTVRALARNASTGHSALATSLLTVPVTPNGDPTVLPPFFHASAGPWVMVKSSPRANAKDATLEYPFACGGEAFIPTALPVVERGTPAQVSIVTFNLGDREKGEPLVLAAEILGPDGLQRRVDVQVLRRLDAERDGARSLLVSFQPNGLESGRYILKVRVSDHLATQSAEAATAFEVRAP